ncbi:sensor histidine kinase [Desulfobacula toluolica]|uniref:histidine kinase n=1 Tax=Desulfobacula toluolica (strain DSM 7467 / Tol2) TaxID=651182 RepID=K0NK85_DESTT|nr:ATP-binding protein [Desulfobacula toluolica]CCK81956.1 two component system sensor histidine kinase [Desulfobacula toluolica Tol2]
MVFENPSKKNFKSSYYYAAVFLLFGFIFFLLCLHYQSQMRLQKISINRLAQQAEEIAASLSYFYDERKNDLENMAESREISAFFENKALGISLEYGLRASQVAISTRFHKFIEKKEIGTDKAFSRLLFIKTDGELLADTGTEDVKSKDRLYLKNFITHGDRQARVIHLNHQDYFNVCICIPYFFKGVHTGQLIALIAQKNIFAFFLKPEQSSCRFLLIMCEDGHLSAPWSDQSTIRFDKPPDFRKIKTGKPQYLKMFDPDGKLADMIMFKTRIKGTPFFIIDIHKATEVLGHISPLHLFMILGISTVIICCGTIFFFHSSTRTLILSSRLEESQIKEMEIKEKNLHLEEEIIRRKLAERQLKNSRDLAESANIAKSEFLANMSHELRTPLNHIIGFTELVIDKHFGELNPIQEEYLGDVLNSSRHLLSLINDILDLSKVEAGKMDLEPTDIHLKTLLENSLVMIKEKAMKIGIQVSADVDGLPEMITADERKLKQIIYNLLSNAVKFTPDGGKISLVANLAESSGLKAHGMTKTVQISTSDLERHRHWITISVADTGVGIKSEDMERIFNHFEQVENSTSRCFEGTGLGLALSRRFVEMHGGMIWAQSLGHGKGSTFSFIIPLQPEDMDSVSEIDLDKNC